MRTLARWLVRLLLQLLSDPTVKATADRSLAAADGLLKDGQPIWPASWLYRLSDLAHAEMRRRGRPWHDGPGW